MQAPGKALAPDMMVEPNKSREISLRIWRGEPVGVLTWWLAMSPPQLEAIAVEAGHADSIDYVTRELGALAFENLVHPFDVVETGSDVSERREGKAVFRTYRSPRGTLEEIREEGRIRQYRVRSPQDLKTLMDVWRHTEVRPRPDRYEAHVRRVRDRGPIGIATSTSAVQMMIQREMGLEYFWYAVADAPALVEEAMAVYQDCVMQPIYRLMGQFKADGYYQGENTSTTLISPEYYRRYSVAHIRQFTEAVSRLGGRSIVHMCGLLRNLMPIFPETGMNGIDSVTPPSVGDCPFEYAFEVMPQGFFCTGRFNSSLWFRKSRSDIINNLASILPHRVYRERPFTLIVTSDAVPGVTRDDLCLLRDCINEYEASAR